MNNRDSKRSPLKSTQWAKRGYTVPKDSDGAYRMHGRIDKRNIQRETLLKRARLEPLLRLVED
jgi:hypothetical protein